MAKDRYTYIEDWAMIRLADSFVKENKAGTGNGEACLYVGSIKTPGLLDFYGGEDFDAECIMLKEDLIEYMNSIKIEYLHHRFNYRNVVNGETWQEKLEEIKALPEEFCFNLTRKRKSDRTGRVYAQDLSSSSKIIQSFASQPKAFIYDLIRRISIPEVTCLLLTKIETENGFQFLAKLFYDRD